MYYHSIEWGFDTDYMKKKNKAMCFLQKHCFKTCISRVCSYSEIASMFFENEGCFLVMISKKNNSAERNGYFDISNYSQLLDRIANDYGKDCDLSEYDFCFIDQLEKMKDCFTANIFSDGHGKIIVEYLMDTVDNRDITGYSQNGKIPHSIIIDNDVLVKCDSYLVLMNLYDVIKKCIWLRGYYELSYATVHSKPDIYFSYYSSEDIYMNIFMNDFGVDYKGSRSVYLFMKNAGYIY